MITREAAAMTHKEMIREYTRAYKNMLSSSAEKRLAQLDAEAAKEGLRFQMTNERQWMLPNFIGDPHFELIKA